MQLTMQSSNVVQAAILVRPVKINKEKVSHTKQSQSLNLKVAQLSSTQNAQNKRRQKEGKKKTKENKQKAQILNCTDLTVGAIRLTKELSRSKRRSGQHTQMSCPFDEN